MYSPVVLIVALVAFVASGDVSAYVLDAPSLLKNVTVAGYINVTRDMCDIQAYASKLDYYMANQTYELGKNARRLDGTFRRPKVFTTSSSQTDELWFEQYKKYYGGKSGFLHRLFGYSILGFAPYDISRQARVNSIRTYATGYLTIYMFHEVDAGYLGALEGDFAGAAYEALHGLAVFWGREHSTCNAVSFYQSGAAWGCTLNASKTSKHLVTLMTAFKELQAAASKNSTTAYLAARGKLHSAAVLSYLQWVQRNANGAASAKTIDNFRGSLAGARAAFDIVAPLVAAKSPAAAKALTSALNFSTFSINSKVASQVKAAITTYVQAAGFKYTDVYNCK